MPGVLARYYRPDDPAAKREAKTVDERGDKERRERKALLDRYWAYYDGQHHQPLKVEPGEPNDNVIVNLCAQAIDKEVAFFAPKPPKMLLPGETPKPGDDSAAQQALDRLWDFNTLDGLIVELAMSGFVGGHTFIKLLMPEDGQPPEVAVLDARHVTVFWDAMNVKRVLWYRLQWEVESGNERRQDIVPAWLLNEKPEYDARSEWVIIEYERTKQTRRQWAEAGRDPWPYPFAPVVQWKNLPAPHQFYGPSDLKHYALNDAVNFTASNTARIIKYHADPKTMVTGADLTDLKATSVGGIYSLPDGATVNTVEMQSDLASSMNMMDSLRTAFFTQMRVVDWASQKDKVGQLTNFGLRVLFGDMLDMTKGKRRDYGRGLGEVSRRALVMMGFASAEPPTAQWEDPLPRDRKEAVEAAKVEKELGFTSDRTLATDLGRDYDEEDNEKKTEGANAGDAFADVLNRINRAGAFN